VEKKKRKDNELRIEGEREEKERWNLRGGGEKKLQRERKRNVPIWSNVRDSGILIRGFFTDDFIDEQLHFNICNFSIGVSVCKV
jgi:hypothetical protein